MVSWRAVAVPVHYSAGCSFSTACVAPKGYVGPVL